jgi:hypothetical protein
MGFEKQVSLLALLEPRRFNPRPKVIRMTDSLLARAARGL